MQHRFSALKGRRAAALVALTVLGAAGRAAALSCADAPWESTYLNPLIGHQLAVPVDAHPWRYRSCWDGVVDVPSECVLVDGSDSIAVEVEASGTEVCALDDADMLERTSRQYLLRFVPAAPLTPGREYTLECKDDPYADNITVRDDETPSAPPPAIAITDTHYSRDANGCCGWGDTLVLRVDGGDAPAFHEGAIIEVAYPNGQILVLPGADESGALEVPPTEGTLVLTPVAADGTRGEPVELDGGDVSGDLVYLPCSVAARTSPAALWLLTPFFWISAHGRRRGRAS